MAGSLIRGPSIAVFVPTIQGLKYGFPTNNVKFTEYGDPLFGQIAFEAQAGVIFGANSPKPRRASKKFAGGRVSSFIDFNKAATLKAAKWRVTLSEKRGKIKTSGTKITVCVNTPFAYKYAWYLRATQFDTFSPFGVEQPQPNDVLVFGSKLKPPKATRETTEGTISTFIAPNSTATNAAAAAGFTVEGINELWNQT